MRGYKTLKFFRRYAAKFFSKTITKKRNFQGKILLFLVLKENTVKKYLKITTKKCCRFKGYNLLNLGAIVHIQNLEIPGCLQTKGGGGGVTLISR